MQRLSGKDVEARLPSGRRILFEQVSLTLDDGIVATTDQGYPNGWVGGAVNGEGSIEVATEMLSLLNGEAELAGAWEAMEPFDLTLFGKVGDLELDVKVHGVKLKFPTFEFNGAGGEKLQHTIAFVVSSPDFVHLNGVPLARRPAA